MWDDLATDVQWKVMCFLPLATMCAMAQTCKATAAYTRDTLLNLGKIIKHASMADGHILTGRSLSGYGRHKDLAA